MKRKKERKRIERMYTARTRAASALHYRMVIGECYQLAGAVLMGPDRWTPGQQERLNVLLLDVLSEPERFSPSLIDSLYRLAIKP